MTSAPDDLREKMGDAIRYWLAFGSTARRTVEDVLAAIEAAGWNLVPMEDVVGNMDISDPTTPQAAAPALAREEAAFRAGAEAMREKAANEANRYMNKFAADGISDCSMHCAQCASDIEDAIRALGHPALDMSTTPSSTAAEGK